MITLSRKKKSGRRVANSIVVCYAICTVFVIGILIGAWQCAFSCDENDSLSLRNKAALPSFQKQSIFFIVVIFSAPSNREKREIIRKTWLLTGKNLPNKQHFFAIGTSSLDTLQTSELLQEHYENGDLLILDAVNDSFAKLSIKLLETLRWLDKYIDFTYLLKVDDDSFVRLDAVHRELVTKPKERLYWGFFDGQARVKIKGKWKEQNWFLCDRYLPYAKGGGYVLTSDLVHNVVIISEYVSLYQNEDVTLGTWLAPFEIQRLHDARFDTEYMSRGCSNSYLVTHKQTTSMMLKKYNNLKETGKMCSSEYKDRNSYEYNWQMPPSLCCIRNNTNIP